MGGEADTSHWCEVCTIKKLYNQSVIVYYIIMQCDPITLFPKKKIKHEMGVSEESNEVG